jgi:hypothetical protein
MVASRLVMSREAFDGWLTSPIPSTSAIVNAEEMFRGWFWDGKGPDPVSPAEWAVSETELTPSQLVAARVRPGSGGVSILRHRDGATEIYLQDIGYAADWIRCYLLMVAGAARFVDGTGDQPAVLWAETTGRLWPRPGSVLALLTVSPAGARFVDRFPLDEAAAALTPLEDTYVEMLTRIVEGEPEEIVLRDARYLDPAI